MRMFLWLLTLPAGAAVFSRAHVPEPVCGQAPGTVCVPAATHDIAPGQTIAEEDIRWIELPERYVSEWARRPAKRVVGRVLRERILVDELIREERLVDPYDGGWLDNVGRRRAVVPVHLDEIPQIIAPMSYVDVLVTQGTADGASTTTVASGAQMLRADPDRSEVLLVITPEERDVLALIPDGVVKLTLRGDVDVVGVCSHGGMVEPLPGALEIRRVWPSSTSRQRGRCGLSDLGSL